jgi:hypothetical protein
MFRLEFSVPNVTPQELFNVLIAKANESSWGSQVTRADILEYKEGVRGVHEMLAMPRLISPRELWEWQAATHDVENGTYLIVLSSQTNQSTTFFNPTSVEAVQCLAAYEITQKDGHAFLRTISHVNPHAPGPIGDVTWFWEWFGPKMLGEWASELSAKAQQVAGDRKLGHPIAIDEGVLALLDPTAPVGYSNISVKTVLESQKNWRHEFAHLDIPAQLNASIPIEFAKLAANVYKLGLRLKSNATGSEFSLLSIQAVDRLDLQLQGEALSAIQWRIREEIANNTCFPSGWKPPDINGNAGLRGLTMSSLIMVGVGLFVVLVALVVCCCCAVGRCRRRKRDLRLNSVAMNAPLACGPESRLDTAETGSVSRLPADASQA